jgi:hypothetical protein
MHFHFDRHRLDPDMAALMIDVFDRRSDLVRNRENPVSISDEEVGCISAVNAHRILRRIPYFIDADHGRVLTLTWIAEALWVTTRTTRTKSLTSDDRRRHYSQDYQDSFPHDLSLL